MATSRVFFHFRLATRLELASKIEMNRDFHFDSHRRPIKQRWLILPLQHRFQCRGYQQRVAAQSARLHHVAVLIDHGVDYHSAPDVRLHRECRILGLDRIGLPRCFEVGANANNSLPCGLLRRWDQYRSPRATDNSTERTAKLSTRHTAWDASHDASQVRGGS